MFEKILIANRGEIALRVMRTCREMGIRSVAVHSPVDALSPHCLAADEVVALAGDEPAASYLSIAQIIDAARSTGAQAIHPGYGFLSENPALAEACAQAGLTFIGPPAHVLSRVGDKLEARKLAEKAGVAVTPGTLSPSSDQKLIHREAVRVGFPVMVKAAAGGGGKGMRRVDDPAALAEAVERAASEAKAAFGDDRLYLEKCIERPRHVEVQVLADNHGQAVHLFERECSIQRRHQKIIEEAPCPSLDSATRLQLCDAALRVVREADYRGAGTVEFLLAPDGTFTFMEVNARLQVEHPVTEAICGLDLVRHQIRLAAGYALGFEQADLQLRGHAIECRIYAEDAQSGFLPSPGEILDLVSPQGPGVRFDCGVAPGSPVPVHYDPILAKLITWGESRSAALARMDRALAETAVLGVQTPIELLLSIVRSEAFRQGRTDTAFLSEHFADWRSDPDQRDILLLGWLVAELSGLHPGAVRTQVGGSEPGAQVDPWASLGRFRMED